MARAWNPGTLRSSALQTAELKTPTRRGSYCALWRKSGGSYGTGRQLERTGQREKNEFKKFEKYCESTSDYQTIPSPSLKARGIRACSRLAALHLSTPSRVFADVSVQQLRTRYAPYFQVLAGTFRRKIAF